MHPITHAETRPDRPAIVVAGSGETVTYAELDRTANRFAHFLRAQGLGRDDAFGLLMENNALYLQLVWGSQRAGTMLVPVSTRLTAPEIAYILKDSGAKLLITTEDLVPTALPPRVSAVLMSRTGIEHPETTSSDGTASSGPDIPVTSARPAPRGTGTALSVDGTVSSVDRTVSSVDGTVSSIDGTVSSIVGRSAAASAGSA